MEELTGLLEQIVLKLDDISDSLREISIKLDNVSGAYSLDEIAEKIDEASRDIRGETGYNLTDIHKDLNDIESAINDIRGETGYNLTDIHGDLIDVESAILAKD